MKGRCAGSDPVESHCARSDPTRFAESRRARSDSTAVFLPDSEYPGAQSECSAPVSKLTRDKKPYLELEPNTDLRKPVRLRLVGALTPCLSVEARHEVSRSCGKALVSDMCSMSFFQDASFAEQWQLVQTCKQLIVLDRDVEPVKQQDVGSSLLPLSEPSSCRSSKPLNPCFEVESIHHPLAWEFSARESKGPRSKEVKPSCRAVEPVPRVSCARAEVDDHSKSCEAVARFKDQSKSCEEVARFVDHAKSVESASRFTSDHSKSGEPASRFALGRAAVSERVQPLEPSSDRCREPGVQTRECPSWDVFDGETSNSECSELEKEYNLDWIGVSEPPALEEKSCFSHLSGRRVDVRNLDCQPVPSEGFEGSSKTSCLNIEESGKTSCLRDPCPCPGIRRALEAVEPSIGASDQPESIELMPESEIRELEKDVGLAEFLVVGMFCKSNLEDLTLQSWWLLDSGASRSVVAEKFLSAYEVSKERRTDPPLTFSTASVEKVEIRREVVLKMSMSGEHGLQRPLLVRCLVSHVEHSLISVFGVCRQGWRFSMGPDTCECTIGSVRANCPWLKADEYVEPDVDSTVVTTTARPSPPIDTIPNRHQGRWKLMHSL